MRNSVETPLPDPDVTGVVLAGGAGRRLGRDKTALRFPEHRADSVTGEEQAGGRDFLARSIALLAKVTTDVRVSCRADSPDLLARASVPIVPDQYPGEGTLRAVLSILRQVRRPCLVIGCDMPFLMPEILSVLLTRRRKRTPGVLQTVWRQAETGYVESLASVYEPACLPWFEGAAARGEYQLNRVILPERRLCLDFGADKEVFFLNVNTQDDWQFALRTAPILKEVRTPSL